MADEIYNIVFDLATDFKSEAQDFNSQASRINLSNLPGAAATSKASTASSSGTMLGAVAGVATAFKKGQVTGKAQSNVSAKIPIPATTTATTATNPQDKVDMERLKAKLDATTREKESISKDYERFQVKVDKDTIEDVKYMEGQFGILNKTINQQKSKIGQLEKQIVQLNEIVMSQRAQIDRYKITMPQGSGFSTVAQGNAGSSYTKYQENLSSASGKSKAIPSLSAEAKLLPFVKSAGRR